MGVQGAKPPENFESFDKIFVKNLDKNVILRVALTAHPTCLLTYLGAERGLRKTGYSMIPRLSS